MANGYGGVWVPSKKDVGLLTQGTIALALPT